MHHIQVLYLELNIKSPSCNFNEFLFSTRNWLKVLSHGCLLSSYKAFFHLHTWFYLSCVLTSSGCKCLFAVYALFPWEASCYKSCLVSHDVSIYCMLYLVDPYGRHYRLPFKSRYCILDIIFLNSCSPSLSSWLLLHSWKDLHQWCRSTVPHNCTMSDISYFFESIVILLFILDYFLNCRHLFFRTSLILLFL